MPELPLHSLGLKKQAEHHIMYSSCQELLFSCFCFHDCCQQLSTAKHWPYHVPDGREKWEGRRGLMIAVLQWRSPKVWQRLFLFIAPPKCAWMNVFMHAFRKKKKKQRLHLYLRDYHLQLVCVCVVESSIPVRLYVCVFQAVSSSA